MATLIGGCRVLSMPEASTALDCYAQVSRQPHSNFFANGRSATEFVLNFSLSTARLFSNTLQRNLLRQEGLNDGDVAILTKAMPAMFEPMRNSGDALLSFNQCDQLGAEIAWEASRASQSLPLMHSSASGMLQVTVQSALEQIEHIAKRFEAMKAMHFVVPDHETHDFILQCETTVARLVGQDTAYGKALKELKRTHGDVLNASHELFYQVCDALRRDIESGYVRYRLAPELDQGESTKGRTFMELAVEEARKSMPEDGAARPRVGAVVVKDEVILAAGYRGELQAGDHAEYTVLEKKLPDELLTGATVYTTLEPCTTRNHPKVPCANRLIERKVRRVVIGMLDPNPAISGKGVLLLRKHNIAIDFFPEDLMALLEELNRDFIRAH